MHQEDVVPSLDVADGRWIGREERARVGGKEERSEEKLGVCRIKARGRGVSQLSFCFHLVYLSQRVLV